MIKTKDSIEYINVDNLVIGAGGAGARAAIEIAQNGGNVALISKEILGKAHTCMAEGGLNVSLKEVNPKNTPKVHFKDTMEGGAWLNNQKLVNIYTKEMPKRVYDLENFGVIFDRDEKGKIAQRFSGKQSQPHTIFIGDYTGREMLTVLVDQIRKYNIPFYDEHFATKIFTKNNKIYGALAIDIKTGIFRFFHTKSILIATGGGGLMYEVTTNAASNTGDGYAMALDAGCELIDMEMIQFHPTGMVFPESARGSLVTESVRGEGGRLFNNKGERYMKRYIPDRMELGGRDEVARANYAEVQAGRGSKHGGVYLDISHLPAKKIEERLPKMVDQFLRSGVDIRKEPMEVHPTMHHMMGGLRINEWGQTNIEGLYAAGEVVGGVHGGNRLGGNAIGECQVFGKRAAIGAMKYSKKAIYEKLNDNEIQAEMDRTIKLRDRKSKGASAQKIHEKLKKTMWNNVGIIKEEANLKQAKKVIKDLKEKVKQIAPKYKKTTYNMEWIRCLELKNMIKTAEIVIEASLLRKDSRGAYFNKDYKEKDKEWNCNIQIKKTKKGLQTNKTPLVTL